MKSLEHFLVPLYLTSSLIVGQTKVEQSSEEFRKAKEARVKLHLTEKRQEAIDILRKVADRYQTAKSMFQITKSLTRYSSLASSTRFENTFAAVKPDKMRMETKGPPAPSMIIVSDGQTTLAGMFSLKQYTRKSVTPLVSMDQSSTDSDPLDPAAMVREMFYVYSKIEKTAKGAKILPDETIDVDNKKVHCIVLAVQTEPPAAKGMEMDLLPQKFWIAKSSLIVQRHESDMLYFTSYQARTVQYVTTTNYSRAMLDEPLPDSLFTFLPPSDWKEVEDLKSLGVKKSRFVDKEAPQFWLKDLEGKKVDLRGLRGKVVLLDFWASWCGPCKAELPHIQKFSDEFKDKGLVVYGINDELPEIAKKFLNENKYTFPTLVDENKQAAKLFAVDAIPQVLIIDRGGIVKSHFIGARSEEVLRAALKKVGLE